MFDIAKLQNISLKDRDQLEPFLRSLNSFSCEMSFSNLAMWHTAYGTQFAFDDVGRLILYSPVERMIYFPRGKDISIEELADLSAAFTAKGLTDNVVYDVPEKYIEKNPEIHNICKVAFDEDNFDYLYENQRLAACEGPKLRKKRNLIKQFKNLYPSHQMIPLTEETSERFDALSQKLNSKLGSCDFIDDENKVISFACKNFRDLSINGILLADGNGNDIAFSIWSLLNPNTADIHFEKADHTAKGAAQALTCEVAAILHSQNVKYMNREQDLGSPGIRQAKHSLDPVFLYRRSSLFFGDRS